MRLVNRIGAAAIAMAVAACAGAVPATPGPSTPAPAGATISEPVPAEPPVAVLTFPDGRATAGDLGTYVFRGAGSDAPWLPGEPVAVPPTGALGRVFLSEDIPVASWAARVAPTGRVPGIGDQRTIGTGAGAIAFELPAGEWTLALSVEFGDGIGSAVWFWDLGQR